MNFCLRSFFIAIVVLHFCRLSTEVQWLSFQYPPGQVCIAWGDTSGGEEDSREFEDDDMAGRLVPILPGEPSDCPVAYRELLAFDDHVGELIVPPPLG